MRIWFNYYKRNVLRWLHLLMLKLLKDNPWNFSAQQCLKRRKAWCNRYKMHPRKNNITNKRHNKLKMNWMCKDNNKHKFKPKCNNLNKIWRNLCNHSNQCWVVYNKRSKKIQWWNNSWSKWKMNYKIRIC